MFSHVLGVREPNKLDSNACLVIGGGGVEQECEDAEVYWIKMKFSLTSGTYTPIFLFFFLSILLPAFLPAVLFAGSYGGRVQGLT